MFDKLLDEIIMVRWNVWCQTNGSLFGCVTTAGCWWWPVWRNNKKSRSNARKTSQTCCFYSSTPWHWVNFSVKCIFSHFLQYFPWKCAQNNWYKLLSMVETPIAVPGVHKIHLSGETKLWHCIFNCDLSIFNGIFWRLLAWLLASVFYTKKGFSIEEPDFLFSLRYWKAKVETRSPAKYSVKFIEK